MLLASREREAAVTVKCFKNFPDAKLDEHWAEKLRTARELRAAVASEEDASAQIAGGAIDWTKLPKVSFTTVAEGVATLEAEFKKSQAAIAAVPEAELNQTGTFFGPDMPLRRLDALWAMLMDQIHHRGQFSGMLRLAGAKVPSISGPSADEPMTKA